MGAGHSDGLQRADRQKKSFQLTQGNHPFQDRRDAAGRQHGLPKLVRSPQCVLSVHQQIHDATLGSLSKRVREEVVL